MWVEELRLEPHPEGGCFRQTYKAELTLAQVALPNGFTGTRAASTAIYLLFEGEKVSAFHRLRSDKVWHFYDGAPLVAQVIEPQTSPHEHSIPPLRRRGRIESLRGGGFLGEHFSDALDLRADAFQLFFNVLVAAVDVVDTIDDGFAVGNQSGNDERGGGAEI